jgi:hypothetical protein
MLGKSNKPGKRRKKKPSFSGCFRHLRWLIAAVGMTMHFVCCTRQVTSLGEGREGVTGCQEKLALQTEKRKTQQMQLRMQLKLQVAEGR